VKRLTRLLLREIKEEIDVKIEVGELLDTIEYDYPNFHLSMDCFWCSIVSGEIILKEAENAKWLSNNKLFCVEWLPADSILIERIAEMAYFHEMTDLILNN
jgi:8-oxo-dGTP diphosphatase